MKYDNVRIHDIEVFPNVFIDTFLKPESKEIWMYLVTSISLSQQDYSYITDVIYTGYHVHWIPNVSNFLDWLKGNRFLLVGYNSYEFDDPLLVWIDKNWTQICSSKDNFLNSVYQASSIMLENNKDYKFADWLETCDLMRVLNVKSVFKPLKQLAGNLRFENIVDFNHYFGQNLTKELLFEMIAYNKQDLLITERALIGVPEYIQGPCVPKTAHVGAKEAIDSRLMASKEYNASLVNQTDSGIANVLNNILYERYSGISQKDFKEKRTGYEEVFFTNVISNKIEFKIPELQSFLTHLKTIIIPSKDLLFFGSDKLHEIDRAKLRNYAKQYLTFNTIFCELPLTFGIGGMHSTQSPQIFSSSENVFLRDIDADSYYPSLMDKLLIYPRHLGEGVLNYLRSIVYDRVDAKYKAKDKKLLEEERLKYKLKANMLKIAVNSIFGKLNFPHFWWCDFEAMLKVTINGQLALLMMIEDFYVHGMKTVYANTDGITVLIPKELDLEANEVCKRWTEKLGITLGITEFDRMYHQDCNNYIVVTKDGEVKAKGRYDYLSYTEKYGTFNVVGSFRYPIVPYAVQQYFIKGVPIEDTIYSHDDILDFCICGKIGRQFTPILRDVVTRKEEVVQQTQRYYIAKTSLKLYKRKRETYDPISKDFYLIDELGEEEYENGEKRGSDFDVCCGYGIQLANDVTQRLSSIEEYKIDYSFYIRECRKLIDPIEGKYSKQQFLF